MIKVPSGYACACPPEISSSYLVLTYIGPRISTPFLPKYQFIPLQTKAFSLFYEETFSTYVKMRTCIDAETVVMINV
jgi:hypothetical protein